MTGQETYVPKLPVPCSCQPLKSIWYCSKWSCVTISDRRLESSLTQRGGAFLSYMNSSYIRRMGIIIGEVLKRPKHVCADRCRQPPTVGGSSSVCDCFPAKKEFCRAGVCHFVSIHSFLLPDDDVARQRKCRCLLFQQCRR